MAPAVPASEIVREAEAAQRRAWQLREEARRLLAEADAVEAATLARATEALGEELGRSAVAMAAWTVTGKLPEPGTQVPANDAALSGEAEVPDRRAAVPVPAAPARTEAPERQESLPPAARQPSPQQNSPARIVIHGVEVPPYRSQEAEDILAQVSSLFAQGRKANPYASDRGKNAWRKLLFKAAWEALAAGRRFEPPAPPASAAPDPADVPSVLPAAVAPPPGGPLAEDMADLDEEEGAISPARDDGSARHAGQSGDGVQEDEGRELPGSEAGAAVEGSADSGEHGSDPLDEPLDGDGPAPSAAKASTHPVDRVAPSAAQGYDPDPLDDLDADSLPPASDLPPPRGYQESPRPAAPVLQQGARPAAPAGLAPSAKPVASGQTAAPEAVRAAPQEPSSRPAAPRPPAAPRTGSGPIPMHTPMAVPPNRRPGFGQALQQPSMPPSAKPPPTAPASRPPAPPGRPVPPSFTNR